jgi:nicotinamidase/pyrazinamidase
MNALLLIDIQNDFLPGGALAVPHGDEVVPVANRLIPRFPLVVATQDWHPADHASFASQHAGRNIGDVIELDGLPQVLWPDHCVQGTHGAEFAPALHAAGIHHVVRKGTDRTVDSYSGFFDNARRRDTGLAAFLTSRGVTRLVIVGLATDYCVKATALDARSLGLDVAVVREGVRAVELRPGDTERAFAEMRAAGVSIISEADVDHVRS